ncbi:MAG: radical SAM protein [Clostridiales bacterium]|nr:radical SAM protein [Clostridiales bacterium]
MPSSFTIARCELCPRRCGAARGDDPSAGRCGMPALPTAARAAVHWWEEPCISGPAPKESAAGGGSGTIFFSGCTLSCVYCQNAPISHQKFGRTVSIQRLADIFRELTAQGVHNINLVNPTHFVPAILRALERYRPPIPLVYNSGGYERVETLRLLEGAVDVYLPDLKYREPELAARLSGAADYVERACEAILEMARQTGPMQLDSAGIARRGTMVRHLVLPGHTRNSLAVLDWLKEQLPAGCYVSLLFQYTPIEGLERYPKLTRRLTRRECSKVLEHLLELGLTEGYVQERDSAGSRFIPAFDLTGMM